MGKRTSNIDRKTSETSISLSLNLDGEGKRSVSTGIGFLDHMLDLFAKHALFDLEIKAEGDTNVDFHHTV
ncbi:MAG: imidazoleglycerol-phosphate dehydratase, partial [Candidatus Marinimicrobia bacterium]|nr:imidazoleglycerol-phosphate dehydratase [Candidatus Neomarinimicrobiota bacterium]